MTQTSPTPGTASVPAAAQSSDSVNVAALQYLSAAMASLSQASQSHPVEQAQPASSTVGANPALAAPVLAAPVLAAPVPATPVLAAPAPAGFLTQGPWVAGGLYLVVPPTGLLPIAEEAPANEDDLPRWYCITRGRYVGLTLNNALALAAITNVSGGNMKGYKTQALALQAFNDMLQYHMVAVVP